MSFTNAMLRLSRCGIALALLAVTGCAGSTQSHGAGISTSAKPTPCAGNPSSDLTILESDSISVAPRLHRIPGHVELMDLIAPGDSGFVRLAYVVNTDGSVDSASVKALGSSDPRLAARVIVAYRKATFWPGCKGDLAVRSSARQTIRYSVVMEVRRMQIRRTVIGRPDF